MKVNVKTHIVYKQGGVDGDFRLSMFEMDSCGYVTVDVRDFEVEIPDDFDPRTKQVEALRREKQRISAEFSKRVTDIEEQINRLTAIEA